MINISNLGYILIAYILGSIPFGYIITKLSTQQNILEIGWRKTSGSNVFKNVGFWQGFFTGVFDIAKGYLAVRIAQNYGQPELIQALSGTAAVIGHNWSLFLKFNGGRGIGTFGGALYALSPEIFKIGLVIIISWGIIWNLSIGTILMLLAVIYYGNQFDVPSVEWLGLYSLLPVFLKRLSPIKELRNAEKRKKVLLNRLIFDDDVSKDWRIKKIVARLTGQ